MQEQERRWPIIWLRGPIGSSGVAGFGLNFYGCYGEWIAETRIKAVPLGRSGRALPPHS
jgi:hypothetical protein